MHSFLHSSVTSSLLGPNIFLSTIYSNTLRVCSSLNVVPNFTPIQITGNLIVFIRLITMRTKYKMGGSDPDVLSQIVGNLVVRAVDDMM